MIAQLVILIGCVTSILSARIAAHKDNSKWNTFKDISTDEWIEFTKYVIDSDDQENRYESYLIEAQITVKNGSLSHVQLLDTMPNVCSQHDSKVAEMILKAGLYVYNARCAPIGISGQHCQMMLSDQELPANTPLGRACRDSLERNCQGQNNNNNTFQRLLPRHYQDGFYKMFENLPPPLDISRSLCQETKTTTAVKSPTSPITDSERNLAVMQWAQFTAHDLSKPVVTSMVDGMPIECCDHSNYPLPPRHRHPACEALISNNKLYEHAPPTCLSYVRSTLAVGSKCTFAAPEQLNEASGSLDLSPIYGTSQESEHQIRSFKDGLLKFSDNRRNLEQPLTDEDTLLPLATEKTHKFCISNETNAKKGSCFMAADSRVNSNPYSIAIYTLFMRNHNRLARLLKAKYIDWKDERLFVEAKYLNQLIYARIIYNEWLPEVLGTKTMLDVLNVGRKQRQINKNSNHSTPITNEFAVAASRFYFSMIPNILHLKGNDPNVENILLNNEIYSPSFNYTSEKLEIIFQALVNERALAVDTKYSDSLISDFDDRKRPTHNDVLAFDIQRGRDHGLQPYVEYVKLCNKIDVTNWKDLLRLMGKKDIEQLRKIYNRVKDIDLMVGAISEKHLDDALVGPTFECIISKQFSMLWEANFTDNFGFASYLDIDYMSIGAHLLCLNTRQDLVPQNIFRVSSTDKNPLINCTTVRQRASL